MPSGVSGSVLGVWALALWLAALATGPAYATSESAPWTGFAGVTETTAAIMAREAAGRLPAMGRTVRPGRVPAMRGRPQHPAAHELERTGLAAARTAPAPAVAQTPSSSFTGATLADTGAFPPDSMGAVGPSQFVVAINGRLRTFNKASGVADGVLDTMMDSFFASVMTPVSPNFTSDPRIRYDRLSGRWFVQIIDVPGGNGTSPNRVLLAVSNAASAGVITASTVWTYFFFKHDTVSPPGDTGDFADFPTLGVDANALYVGVNVFAPSGSFVNSTGFVVRKSSVLGAGPIVVTAFRSLLDASSNGPYTPQGVDNPDPAATVGYFIGVDGAFFGRLQLRRVTNPGGAPSLSGNLAVNVPATAYPILVPHLGNTGGANGQLDSLDDRLSNAIIRNGSLWTAHNIGIDNTGSATGTVTRNGVRWYQIGSLGTTPALVQSGIVFTSSGTNNTSSRYYWIPSIMASGQGHVAIGFSTAGSLERANAGTTGRLTGDAAGTTATPTLYTASATAYNPPSDAGGAQGRRWGDFSYTSPDPDDDMTLWTRMDQATFTLAARDPVVGEPGERPCGAALDERDDHGDFYRRQRLLRSGRRLRAAYRRHGHGRRHGQQRDLHGPHARRPERLDRRRLGRRAGRHGRQSRRPERHWRGHARGAGVHHDHHVDEHELDDLDDLHDDDHVVDLDQLHLDLIDDLDDQHQLEHLDQLDDLQLDHDDVEYVDELEHFHQHLDLHDVDNLEQLYQHLDLHDVDDLEQLYDHVVGLHVDEHDVDDQ